MLIFLAIGLSLAALMLLSLSEHYAVVSKTWYDGVFCDQAEPVGQEDV